MTDAPNVLETSPLVESCAKNDHLGFQVHYTWRGIQQRYLADFIVRHRNGKPLVLEIEGENSEPSRAKVAATRARVEGVNTKGGFRTWCRDIADEMARNQDSLVAPGGTARMNGGRPKEPQPVSSSSVFPNTVSLGPEASSLCWSAGALR